MPRIPSSALQRAIMRQQAKVAAERAIYMRRRRNEVLNRFRPTDEELDEIIRIEETQRPYRRPGFPVDRIPSAGPEDGLDYGRPYNSLRRRTYPEYRTMEYRYGRDDVKPVRLDDGVFRPNDHRYRDARLTPMADFDYEDVVF